MTSHSFGINILINSSFIIIDPLTNIVEMVL